MAQSFPAAELREKLGQVKKRFNKNDSLRLIRASSGYQNTVHLDKYSLSEVIDLGISLGTKEFYVEYAEDDAGEIKWIRFYFIHNSVPHIQYIESEAIAQAREEETEEKEEELERKQALSKEMLEQYEDVLNNAEEYRLRHSLSDLPMERLFRMQDQLQEKLEQKRKKERINEELEVQLARKVYEDSRFDRQFNKTDTEVLLEQLDVEFESDAVRIDKIHRHAKSLLKVNK